MSHCLCHAYEDCRIHHQTCFTGLACFFFFLGLSIIFAPIFPINQPCGRLDPPWTALENPRPLVVCLLVPFGKGLPGTTAKQMATSLVTHRLIICCVCEGFAQPLLEFGDGADRGSFSLSGRLEKRDWGRGRGAISSSGKVGESLVR